MSFARTVLRKPRHSGCRFLVMLGVLLVVSSCARPPEVIGIENADVPVEAVPDLTTHRIFIATTRKATDLVGVLFSGERAPDLGLASVDVTVPPTHVVGQIERPKRLPPDPRTEFTIVNPAVYKSSGAFVSSINRELAKKRPSQRNLLYFVHGYNNTTTDALLRLAQFVEDTEFDGVTVLMSWASAARTTGYVYDLNSAFVARRKLPEIARILERTDANTLNIFAHSMGTLLTMEGIASASQTGRISNIAIVDNIMLASPDIDIDLFRTQMEVIPQSIKDKIYILTSQDDRALKASRRVAGGIPRVGLTDAEALEEEFGVVVIDLSEIDDSGTNSHSKFASSPEVVQLIGFGLNSTDDFGQSTAPPIERVMANTPIRIFD